MGSLGHLIPKGLETSFEGTDSVVSGSKCTSV